MCNNTTSYYVCPFNIYDIYDLKIVANTGRKIRDPVNYIRIGRFGILRGGGGGGGGGGQGGGDFNWLETN